VFETGTYVKFEMNLKENFDHVTTPFQEKTTKSVKTQWTIPGPDYDHLGPIG
jgi:hypothetical protein